MSCQVQRHRVYRHTGCYIQARLVFLSQSQHLYLTHCFQRKLGCSNNCQELETNQLILIHAIKVKDKSSKAYAHYNIRFKNISVFCRIENYTPTPQYVAGVGLFSFTELRLYLADFWTK